MKGLHRAGPFWCKRERIFDQSLGLQAVSQRCCDRISSDSFDGPLSSIQGSVLFWHVAQLQVPGHVCVAGGDLEVAFADRFSWGLSGQLQHFLSPRAVFRNAVGITFGDAWD